MPDSHPSPSFQSHVAHKRRSVTIAQALFVTLIAGLATGPIAAIGSLIEARPTGMWAYFYLVVFGPAIEELLKQSGMIYLMKRTPWRVIGSWQFPVAAVLSAAAFATVENLIYLHVYAVDYPPDELAELATYRWTVCTMIHISCSIIASLGMLRVWKHHEKTQQPAQISRAFTLFALAITIHGAYNLSTVIL